MSFTLCPFCQEDREINVVECKSCPCRTRLDYRIALPRGYALIATEQLQQIEEAMAWELGGEPIHTLLVEAQKIVKQLIKDSQEKE